MIGVFLSSVSQSALRCRLRFVAFSVSVLSPPPLTASLNCKMSETSISAPSPLVGSPMASSATDDFDDDSVESTARATATASAGAKTKKKKKKSGCHELSSSASLPLLVPSAFVKVGFFNVVIPNRMPQKK